MMLVELCVGKCVCGVFYGYFGVFVWVLYCVIVEVRVGGYVGWMELGVLVEDCFYVDFGIDFGIVGC